MPSIGYHYCSGLCGVFNGIWIVCLIARCGRLAVAKMHWLATCQHSVWRPRNISLKLVNKHETYSNLLYVSTCFLEYALQSQCLLVSAFKIIELLLRDERLPFTVLCKSSHYRQLSDDCPSTTGTLLPQRERLPNRSGQARQTSLLRRTR